MDSCDLVVIFFGDGNRSQNWDMTVALSFAQYSVWVNQKKWGQLVHGSLPAWHDGACRVWTCLWMETTSIFFNESAFPFPEILNHGLLFEVDLNPQRTGHSVICERDGPVTGFADKLTTLQPISHPPFSAIFLRAWLKITFLSLKLKMTLSLMASSLSGNITEPSYSNEIYDSVSLKALDGFQKCSSQQTYSYIWWRSYY